MKLADPEAGVGGRQQPLPSRITFCPIALTIDLGAGWPAPEDTLLPVVTVILRGTQFIARQKPFLVDFVMPIGVIPFSDLPPPNLTLACTKPAVKNVSLVSSNLFKELTSSYFQTFRINSRQIYSLNFRLVGHLKCTRVTADL